MCMDCFGEKFMQAFHLHLLLLCPSSFRRCAREGHLVGVITRTQERVRLPYMVNGSPLQICLQHGCVNVYEYSRGLDTAHTIIVDISKPKIIPIILEDAFHVERFLV